MSVDLIMLFSISSLLFSSLQRDMGDSDEIEGNRYFLLSASHFVYIHSHIAFDDDYYFFLLYVELMRSLLIVNYAFAVRDKTLSHKIDYLFGMLIKS